MYTRQSAQSVMALAEILAEKGLAVTAVPGTPLAELVGINTDLNSIKLLADNNQEVTHDAFIEQLMSGPSGNVPVQADGTIIENSHDVKMNAFIKFVAKAGIDHIGFTKNTVVPIITAVTEAVTKEFSVPVNPVADYGIRIRRLPFPMQNSMFESEINKYENTPFTIPPSILGGKEMSIEELSQLISTGSKTFDDEIAVWIAAKTPDFLQRVWNAFFRGATAVTGRPNPEYRNINIANSELFPGDADLGISATDYAVGVYLIARAIYDNPVENIQELTMTKYKNLLASYRDSSGSAIYQAYKNWANSYKNKTLIAGFSYDRKTIIVNEHVYKDWLSSGGKQEALLGYLVSEQTTVFSVNALEASAKEFISNWTTFSSIKEATAKANTITRFRDILYNCFIYELEHVSEQEKEYVTRYPNIGDWKKRVMNLATEFVKTIKPVDTEHIDDTVRAMVCRCRFFYTSSEIILTSMMEAIKANPNIEPREAAFVAACKYVCMYLADQMRLTRV